MSSDINYREMVVDTIEQIVKQQGQDARNVISWRVPNALKDDSTQTDPKHLSNSSSGTASKSTAAAGRLTSSPNKGDKSAGGNRLVRKSSSGSGATPHHAVAREYTKEESIAHLSERLWSLLFRNINQVSLLLSEHRTCAYMRRSGIMVTRSRPPGVCK